MTYKYSRGNRKVGDLQFEDDTNTEIDFEDDYIALEAAGTAVLVVSGSNVGIGTTTPDSLLSLDGTQPKIKFTESGQNRAEIFINDSDNLKVVNRASNKHMVFEISDGGTLREGLRLRATSNIQGSTSPEVVINDGSTSLMDFRVESDNNTHMIYVDGANDKVGINTKSPSQILDIDGDTIRLRSQRTIPSSNTFGEAGEICYDQNYIYICIATDTWRRVAISSW
jgi:hypothetical protein|tara:strand:+ start:111 stop:785 length:675 start_codon:yes stop_codon:yes gene_type:complete